MAQTAMIFYRRTGTRRGIVRRAGNRFVKRSTNGEPKSILPKINLKTGLAGSVIACLYAVYHLI